MRLLLYSLVLLSVFFIASCASQVEETAEERTNLEQPQEAESPRLLAGTISKYYRFDKEHYKISLKEGKVIFLDFYANWCPICRSESPNIIAAFDELNNPDVVGYRVHYNDNEVTDDDKEMAQKFGITYQHTKVVLDKNGNVALKSLEAYSKDDVINAINKAFGG